MDVLTVGFTGGTQGPWAVTASRAVVGAPLADAAFVSRTVFPGAGYADGAWTLRGFTSNLRYTTRREANALASRHADLGRETATCAALIPIRKSAAWWTLSQDERREIYEERSRHTSIGMDYLPQIARKLHHSRDLGEPFDFITWFEFAPQDQDAFDELLARLRATEEWHYVEREVEIRLERA